MFKASTALLLCLFLFQAESAEAQGDAQTGKELWTGQVHWCRNCHGSAGQGGFGPDLAGRQLTFERLRRAVRQPWGIMPAFPDEWLSDRDLATLTAYLNNEDTAYLDGLPRWSEPGEWRTPVPPGAPLGQELLIANAGCGQCHGPVMAGSRMDIGAIAADFEWFKRQVYEHTAAMPKHRALLGEPNEQMRMGNYSKTRLPESVLEEIWRFTLSLGSRAYIRAQLSSGVRAETGVTYTLAVDNGGLPDKGLPAEDVSISIKPAPGFIVTNTTGPGDQGIRRDEQNNAETAVWNVPRIGPREKHMFSITLSGSGNSGAIAAAEVRWSKPLSEGAGDSISVPLPRSGPTP